MVEALKKLDKKFLIVAGCMLGIPIILIVILGILQGCSNSKLTPEKYENKMIEATEKYLQNKKMEPTEEGATVTVKLSDLVDGEYIKSPEKALDDSTCEGYVIARRNGSTVEENNGGFINYTVNLDCKEYETETLNDLLKEDIVTTGSGLYQQGNGYIFKGDDVNNYITFFGHTYVIYSMDSTGILKLIKTTDETVDKNWDNKYNTETNEASGKNIYRDSQILKQLKLDYNNVKKISSSAKKHVVAYDVCIDARDENDLSINYDKACTNVLENQFVSLMYVDDFAKASLDSECLNISSKSCRNYNYLRRLSISTWTPTAVSNNSYEAYYVSNGLVRSQEANRYNAYNLVIYIDGAEKVVSGTGTQTDPYVIK